MSPFGPYSESLGVDFSNGAPKARSPLAGLMLPCASCGWNFKVTPSGRVPAHRQWRISPRGTPYRHESQCDGGAQPPDTSDLGEEMV